MYHYVLWTDGDYGDGKCKLEKNIEANFCCVPDVNFDAGKLEGNNYIH